MNNTAEDLISGVLAGHRRALARAITLVESTRSDHQRTAEILLAGVAAHTGGAHRLAISGPPGAGKSHLIEALGCHAIAHGRRVAVLAIDPSSARSGGSILGDKTRMPRLTQTEQAFVRPSPAPSNHFGGIAKGTRESILLCEAAGFDTVIMETVGVGQTETAAAAISDTLVLVLAPAGGDELQGIKRGIVEVADLIVINKADGALRPAAEFSAAQYTSALRLFRPRDRQWQTPVVLASAHEDRGIDSIWERIEAHRQHVKAHRRGSVAHAERALDLLWAAFSERLRMDIQGDAALATIEQTLAQQVARGDLPPALAAARLLDRVLATFAAAPQAHPDRPAGADFDTDASKN